MKIKLALIIVLVTGVAVGVGSYLLLFQFNQKELGVVVRDPLFGWKFPVTEPINQQESATNVRDPLFGWKYPVAKFPNVGSQEEKLAYSDIRDPGGIPEGLPVRLRVPAIGVDSAIEDAFITPEGRMDVPVGSINVAWFALGPYPGRVGSAVIGGHFGIKNGVPFVFYDLDKLSVGDKVYIENDRGETLAFIVRGIGLFGRDDDATTVFTSDDGLAHLNLITCEGIWNRINDTYPERRVVFTDAIPLEAAGAITPYAFYRPLALGASGADVVALQTYLEQKGLLTMPAGVAKGYLGALTRAAIIRYQTSVGLPRAGIFGPLTRAKLVSELIARKPKLPSTAISKSTVAPSFSQTVIRSLKTLYATPLDGLITSFLLISLVFAAFKLYKRRGSSS